MNLTISMTLYRSFEVLRVLSLFIIISSIGFIIKHIEVPKVVFNCIGNREYG